MSRKKSGYTSGDVDVLEGLEGIKRRPAMYIQDTHAAGYHQILKEVIDNGIDEYTDGHANRISIHINTTKQIATVQDNGRGIPVTIHKATQLPTLTTIFTKLHSGGKFGGAYTSATSGLHGIGIKATNALSTRLDVWTNWNGTVYHQRFSQGEAVTEIKKTPSKKLSSGTIIKFQPDSDIFGRTRFSPQRIETMLQHVPYLCPGLTITLRVDKEAPKTYSSDKGLLDMITRATEGAGIELLHDPLAVSSDDCDFVLAWSRDADGEAWKSFVNVSPTPQHGTHVAGLKKAIQTTLSKTTLASKEKVRADDLRDGLIAIVHAKVPEPQFQSQTKVKLNNQEVEGQVLKLATKHLKKFFANNPDLVKYLVSKAVQLRDARSKFKAQKEAIRSVKVTRGAKGLLPGKLCEAPDCPPSRRELFIVEGDSASGPVKRGRVKYTARGGRTVHFQEVLPLRGKTLNTARVGNIEKVVKNNEISSIVQAIGTGLGDAFDIRKCRYRAIFILSDADPDGRHISAILLAFFARFMPELIEAGMVYVVKNPLFMGVSAKKRAYGATKEEVKKELGSSKIRLTRFKGLGEAGALPTREYAMDPNTRKVLKVMWGGDRDRELVLKFMGSDSSVRKKLLGVRE